MKLHSLPSLALGMALLSGPPLAAQEVKEYAKIDGHLGAVLCLAFTADSKILAAGDANRAVLLADVSTGKVTKEFTHDEQLSRLAFSPDGKMLTSAVRHDILLLAKGECKIKLWDSATGKERVTPPGHDNSILALAFTPDGKALSSASLISPETIIVGSPDEQYGATVMRWDVKTAKEIASVKVQGIPLAFSPDCQSVATASYELGWIKLWDVEKGKERVTLKTGANRCAAFNPKGTVLATSISTGADGDDPVEVELWDLATGKKKVALKSHKGGVSDLFFSADGKLLASGGKDGTIKLWDVDKERLIVSVKGHEDGVLCVAISPDGKVLASGGGDSTTKLWDVAKLLGKKAPK